VLTVSDLFLMKPTAHRSKKVLKSSWERPKECASISLDLRSVYIRAGPRKGCHESVNREVCLKDRSCSFTDTRFCSTSSNKQHLILPVFSENPTVYMNSAIMHLLLTILGFSLTIGSISAASITSRTVINSREVTANVSSRC
jgi:hypothetical protein